MSVVQYNVIGIHGPLNGGKDTVGNYIQARHPNQYRRYSFAQPLKLAAIALFGFTQQQLEDRVLKEQVDNFWGFSPRYALQRLGTEYGRNMLREDVWIKRAEHEVKVNSSVGLGTIITDVRFQNEADWIRSLDNSILIYLDVPGLIRDNKYNHQSEAGITRSQDDFIVVNDKRLGLDPLFKQLDAIVHK